jgi:hypothetical protein
MKTARAGCKVLPHCSHCAALFGLTLFLLGGCQTWQKSHEAALGYYAAGDLNSARDSLQEASESRRAEQLLLRLDQSMLQLASGEVRQSESGFRHLREELQHVAQKDVREQTASIIADSRAVAWSGRDFERQMVLNFALLTSLLGDRQDAFAWSMQVADASTDRIQSLQKSATGEQHTPVLAAAGGSDSRDVQTAAFEPDADSIRPASSPAGLETADRGASETPAPRQDQTLAFGAYLAALVQSEIPTRSQETEELLSSIRYWNPGFSAQVADGRGFGVRSRPGHGAVHVIALVGRAPRWVAESAEPTSAALLIADRLISITGKHTLPPTIAAVKIACPEPFPPVLAPDGLKCFLREASLGSGPLPHGTIPLTFATAVDLEAVALASYTASRDEQIAQAVARRVMKKGAVYVLKETQQISRNSLVDFGINAAGVAWEAIEKPDTRSWRSLPARVDIARIELPAGHYTLGLTTSGAGASGSSVWLDVPVANGRNTCVVVTIPEDRPTGHLLIGGPESRQVPATSTSPSHRSGVAAVNQ